ncbi:MAG: amidohydrolase family protein [Phycisphaerae bacterium]
MTRTFRARWVVPVGRPPIENGRMVVRDGRITLVESATGFSSGDVIDFGDAVILPGFVNAHTHLELTHCRGRVPHRGSFVAWIRDLVAMNASAPPERFSESILEGAAQSLAAGVTTLADIGHGPDACAAWRRIEPRTVGFLEVLGMGPRRQAAHDRSLAAAVGLCEAHQPPAARERLGLSPHAPYSTDPSVYAAAVDFCRRRGRPLCTHLAETRDEARFLRDGTGPFRELLESWNLWDGSFTPPGCSPVRYAARLGLLDGPVLLAHVNYADDDDLDLLARGDARVVYCPRTHRFFGHDPHRYRDMLARRIHVCLGTDSLAGVESLSILDELRFLRSIDSETPDEVLVHMATLGAARALNLDAHTGSLEPGKQADIVVIPLENPGTREPTRDLLESVAAPAVVYLGGAPAVTPASR